MRRAISNSESVRRIAKRMAKTWDRSRFIDFFTPNRADVAHRSFGNRQQPSNVNMSLEKLDYSKPRDFCYGYNVANLVRLEFVLVIDF